MTGARMLWLAAALLGGLFAAAFVLPWADPNNLPHRPLREIDIQGHQPAGRAPIGAWCPGQYGYYLPAEDLSNEIFLYCWGRR